VAISFLFPETFGSLGNVSYLCSVKEEISMVKVPFETYKDSLIEDIRNTTDFESLEARLLDAQLEMDGKEECETNEDLLVHILKLSHQQVTSGRSFSQEEAERFLDQRLYEFRDKMVGTSVAESC